MYIFSFHFLVVFFPIIFLIKEMPRYIAEASISAPTVENIVDSVSLKTEICYWKDFSKLIAKLIYETFNLTLIFYSGHVLSYTSTKLS